MSRPAPLVLSRYVRADRDVSLGSDAPKPEQPASRPLSCVSRRAIAVGRSKDADNALNNLCFETHLADAPALSRLTLQGKGISYMLILAIDYKLILLGTCLPVGQRSHVRYPASQVYLIYDAVDHSITMIPSYPWLTTPEQPGVMRKTAPVTRVLTARPPGGGDDRSYALVNMAETTINYGRNHSSVAKHDVLYIWRSWTSSRRWDLVTTRFPPEFKGDNVAHSYLSVLAFSCGGRAFWANLLRGVMYCNLDALLSGYELEFGFIRQPAELPREISVDHMCPIEMCSGMFRTMGRVGESSIKFVTIDGFVQLMDFVDCTLKVWTLSPEDSITIWTEHSLCLGSLVEQDEFRKAGLPTDMVPMYPGLNPQEADVVYLMLGKYDPCCNRHSRSKSKGRCNAFATTAGNPLYQLCVDMHRGVLLGATSLPDKPSPSVIFADTSLLPSPVVQRESTVGRKCKRRRDDLTL